MQFADSALDDLFNDLTADELTILVGLVMTMDPLEIFDGKPRWNNDEVDLIQKIQEFAANSSILWWEDEQDDEGSEDSSDETESDEDVSRNVSEPATEWTL